MLQLVARRCWRLGRVTTLGLVPGSLLRTLATQREPAEPITIRYDEAAQVSRVFEAGRWVPSWDSRRIENTKKCDHETGEDQKGA